MMEIDRCWQNLGNAIVLKACDDYRSAKRALAIDKHDGMARGEIARIRKFIRSTWFGVLTTIDPEYLIKRLDEEARHG